MQHYSYIYYGCVYGIGILISCQACSLANKSLEVVVCFHPLHKVSQYFITEDIVVLHVKRKTQKCAGRILKRVERIAKSVYRKDFKKCR